ncbi:MAG: tyrosine-protein phosphatase [Rhabdochlamydiaceae bacterium]|nr:tyrosine-protein phosphatase [Candidatus Amphrikana amoebophyrae]
MKDVQQTISRLRHSKKILKKVLIDLKAQKTVLIHCKQGKDRSAALSAVVIALIFNTNFEKAAAFLRSKRYGAEPEEPVTRLAATCKPVLERLKVDAEIVKLVASFNLS